MAISPALGSNYFAVPQVTIGWPMKVAFILSHITQFEGGTILVSHAVYNLSVDVIFTATNPFFLDALKPMET